MARRLRLRVQQRLERLETSAARHGDLSARGLLGYQNLQADPVYLAGVLEALEGVLGPEGTYELMVEAGGGEAAATMFSEVAFGGVSGVSHCHAMLDGPTRCRFHGHLA